MKPLTLIDKAFLLKRTPLFGTLDLDLLLSIADKMGLVLFEAGDEIFPVNQEAHRMYFIAKGTVLIRDAAHQLLARLSTADFFGDESLFNGKLRAYEAISETDTYLLTLSRTHLSMILSECPPVAMGFLQEYSSQMNFRSRKTTEGKI